MKLLSVTSTLLLALSASAFVPNTVIPFGLVRDSVCLDAKHVQKKATKKHADRRPKKSRKSDIFRAPTNYQTFEKPPEYQILDEPAEPVVAASAASEE
mmetsp:Transcript_48011/g.58137  ORF Transcript_48011/g.58137 Transcript_48011/m.58137 type:complete len:98 (+) Transcript_48011:209-502(+)|eukprot:CAMPEP_0172498502 /NCGR_PEP_ID=MMETSP1066-20121228/113475_1 /TAXON_ID=671091 /ORGANISM="Coscinodiscus wailesii, Strain CCMP2513" /LENGTH=97 /DNA_ID=CAMNT_0013271795 /DNA_START=209 /DNA_END=502 /DNA_ORIENTATION=-